MPGRGAVNQRQATTDNAIERTRKYRTPPAKTALTALPCNLITAVERAGHGLKGELVNLLVNWFRIKYDRTRIYVYRVTMTEQQMKQPPPRITHSPTIAKIFWKIVREYRDIFPDLYRVVFDDYEYLFLLKMIGNQMTMSCDHPEKKGKRVDVRVEQLKFFDLDSASSDIRTFQCISIFFKNLMSQNSRYVPPENANRLAIEISQRFAHIDGGLFLIPRQPNSPKIELQPGVEAWLGLYANVRKMENSDLVINQGLINKMFVKLYLNLIDFYLLIENDVTSTMMMKSWLNASSCMTHDAARRFNQKLMNIGLKSDCIPVTDKDGFVTGRHEELHVRFIELKHNSAHQELMKVVDQRAGTKLAEVNRNGRWMKIWWREVYMDDWYAVQGKPLKYPNLPLCLVKYNKREFLVPMEVLFTSDRPQKFMKLLGLEAKMQIAQRLALKPAEHHKYTNGLLTRELDYNNDPFLKAMNVSHDLNMIECEGRRLEPCTVLGKSESDESVLKLEVKKDTGEFKLSRALETSDKKIRFVVYRLTDAVDEMEVKEFYQELVKKCVKRGFNVPQSDYLKPPIYLDQRIDGSEERQMARIIEYALTKFEDGQKDDEVLVFLFFIKLSDAHLYGEIKYLCDIIYGVVSQAVNEETVKKACTKSADETLSDYKSIYHHLCLKLNAKLGGVNQIVAEADEEPPEYGRMPANERTMFIGIDVTHPSPNSPIRDCSLAAIVASMDRNAAKYAVRIKVNRRCNENVQLFDEHFAFLLYKYHESNGFLPDRIVIIRDGLSDQEMLPAASMELNSIREAWRRTANGVECPPITYLVAQKRHKTRFYQRPEEEKGDVTNPPMGTVVDKYVVTPDMFDFYMIPHFASKETTSRPIHYTVVYDDCESSADVIQELLFRLSFLYARCSRPVSLPSPVYYAHLACERAAFHHQYAVSSGEVKEIWDKEATESDQNYATRVERQALEIEKKLQVSEKYPGMHFI